MTIFEKMDSLTQRLDHMVPDHLLGQVENKLACEELKAISEALYELLPDPSLSLLERLERLARVVDCTPHLDQLQSAYRKIEAIKERMNELVPGDGNVLDKLGKLVTSLNRKVPGPGTTIQKLEYLGDPRVPQSAGIDLSPNPSALAM